MELYPAIDIRAGRVVRVRRGDPASEIVYHTDPAAVLEGYVRDGARWVHVVDLDRVFGAGEQTALIASLVRRARPRLRVQVGGGVSSAAEVAVVLATGAARVIVRAAIEGEVAGFEGLVRRFQPERLALALDVRAPGVAAAAVQALEPEGALALARRAARAGLRHVIYTDLGREGRLGGAGIDSAVAVAREAGLEVIVSGGVHTLDELARIRDAGLAGAIIGRALFEGRFTLREALACSDS